MAEESEEQAFDELELAQKILELTTILEKNSVTIEKMDSSIKTWESNIQDLDIRVASKITELSNKVNEDLDTVQNELNSQIKTHKNLEEALQEQEDRYGQKTQELEKEITKLSEEMDSTTKEQDSIKLQVQEMEGKFTNFSEQMESKFNEQKSTISALAEHVRSQFENTMKTDDILNENVNDLNQVTKSHSIELKEMRTALNNFKNRLQDLISISKKDQKTHFENFSRMIESLNENIRTEISLAMQTLKEADIKILNDVSEYYMRKKAGDEIQKSVMNFYEEFQAQSTKSKEDLTESMQNTMMEYEKTIENQTKSIQSYKDELDRIQKEIQDVIDRKVNEKYEAVFSLLATVTMHAEELMMLIKTAEIILPREPGKKEEDVSQQNIDQKKTEEEFQ